MTNKDASPSLKEWEALYKAAVDFKNLKPWTWVWDSDLFGVQNPEDDEIGYCCIMGAAREVFALAVYQGQEGLDAYLRLQSGEMDPKDPELGHIQKCLMASYEDRNDLVKEDLQTIKDLGLKFRGKKEWPQFRSYLPGYVPWLLTAEEARFLIVALEQSIDVAMRLKENKNILIGPEKDNRLIRVPASQKDPLEWQDKWAKISISDKKAASPLPVDELRVKRINKNISNKEGVWEIDFFHFPGAVDEGGRPFYPKTFMIMDHLSGMALHYSIEHPDGFLTQIQENLLGFIEKIKVMPKQILICKPESHRALDPIISRLYIDLEMVKTLKAATHFKETLFNHLLNNPEGAIF